MRSSKHIGKIIITRASELNLKVPVCRASLSINLRTSVSYLIVGGLRGLCSTLAIHLAKKGAKHLVVLSRSGGGDQRSEQVIANIRALGCEVHVIRGDVTCVNDVRNAFQSTHVPIGGIIQGAMVLRVSKLHTESPFVRIPTDRKFQDRLFTSMTIDEYQAALNCKVQGTWNLHNISLEQDLSLDFFTMLSSISGIYGSKGQANYAAANTFLDAFALYRQGLGLPACSVDLGVVVDIGYMAEREDLRNRYDESIWHVIDEKALCRIFELSMHQQGGTPINAQSAAQMITGLRVPQPSDSLLSRDARFTGLFSQGRTAGNQALDHRGPKDLESILVMIRSNAGARAILDTTTQIMNKYLMKILRVSDSLDFARPLSAYGIDSLAAVEVRNFLKVELRVELTTLEIINSLTLISICERVVKELSKMK